jgi:hypothetical protein
MPVELTELSSNTIMLTVRGRLTEAELSEAQRAGTKAIASMDRVRIVVVVEDFEGWQKGADWDDMSFQMENDSKIERMALVGDRKWKELVLAFVGNGLREFPIEYFAPGQMAEARAWALGT